MAQVTFTVGVSTDLEERLMRAVQLEGTSRNAFVRRALEAALATSALGPPRDASLDDMAERHARQRKEVAEAKKKLAGAGYRKPFNPRPKS